MSLLHVLTLYQHRQGSAPHWAAVEITCPHGRRLATGARRSSADPTGSVTRRLLHQLQHRAMRTGLIAAACTCPSLLRLFCNPPSVRGFPIDVDRLSRN